MTRRLINGTLHCKTCKQWLPLPSFSINRAMKYDRNGECRLCRSQHRSPNAVHTEAKMKRQIVYAMNWNKANPEKVRHYQRTYYLKTIAANLKMASLS